MPHKPDVQLIRETLTGSLDAFDQLMLRYERLVFGIAWDFTRNREHALDITQDVFLKAYQKLAGLADGNKFKIWLIRVSYNQCVSWKRIQHPHEFLNEADVLRSGEQEKGLRNREAREKLAGLLARLNPKHRLAVVLRYFEELPIREIAGVLECSEDVVKNILYRSMRRMSQPS